MNDDAFRYDLWIEEALRQVILRALRVTATEALPGDHHFYITFRTGHDDVDIPGHLIKQHLQEMTIVLEHQFWGLEVEEDFFEVTLSFNKAHERLHIPFAAVTSFADPSVKFGMQITSVDSTEPIPMEIEDSDARETDAESGERTSDGGGEVVTLDAFRKRPGRN